MPERQFTFTQSVYHNAHGPRIQFTLREPGGLWRVAEKQLFHNRIPNERELEDITREVLQMLLDDAMTNFKLTDYFQRQVKP